MRGGTVLFQVQLEARPRKKQADSSLPCHHLVFNSILVKESIVVPKKSKHLLCGSVHVLSPSFPGKSSILLKKAGEESEAL